MSLRITATKDGQAIIYNSTTDEVIGRLWHEDENDFAETIATQFLNEFLTEQERNDIVFSTPQEIEEKVKQFHIWRDAKLELENIQELSASLYR